MKKHISMLRFTVVIVGVLLANSLLVPAAVAQAIQFSGSATAIDASVLGLPPVTVGATGEVPATGGELQNSGIQASVPGLLTAGFLSSSVVARGNRSSAESTVAQLSVTVGDNEIEATLLRAQAVAECHGATATVSGSSELAGLEVNDQPIEISGAPNQTVDLGFATIVINKQQMDVQGETGDMNVTALFIDIPGVGTVAIARVHADIRCKAQPTCPDDGDFITGGGWIETTTASRGTFAVAGGKRPGWGHLNYIDHGTKMRVKGTAVLLYGITGEKSRHIEGTCENSNGGGCYYVVSSEEPGRGADTFSIKLFNLPPDNDDVPFYAAGAGKMLSGGNIQLHNQCARR